MQEGKATRALEPGLGNQWAGTTGQRSKGPRAQAQTGSTVWSPAGDASFQFRGAVPLHASRGRGQQLTNYCRGSAAGGRSRVLSCQAANGGATRGQPKRRARAAGSGCECGGRQGGRDLAPRGRSRKGRNLGRRNQALGTKGQRLRGRGTEGQGHRRCKTGTVRARALRARHSSDRMVPGEANQGLQIH